MDDPLSRLCRQLSQRESQRADMESAPTPSARQTKNRAGLMLALFGVMMKLFLKIKLQFIQKHIVAAVKTILSHKVWLQNCLQLDT